MRGEQRGAERLAPADDAEQVEHRRHVCAVLGRRLIVAGGNSPSGVTDQVEAFDADLNVPDASSDR